MVDAVTSEIRCDAFSVRDELCHGLRAKLWGTLPFTRWVVQLFPFTTKVCVWSGLSRQIQMKTNLPSSANVLISPHSSTLSVRWQSASVSSKNVYSCFAAIYVLWCNPARCDPRSQHPVWHETQHESTLCNSDVISRDDAVRYVIQSARSSSLVCWLTRLMSCRRLTTVTRSRRVAVLQKPAVMPLHRSTADCGPQNAWSLDSSITQLGLHKLVASRLLGKGTTNYAPWCMESTLNSVHCIPQ